MQQHYREHREREPGLFLSYARESPLSLISSAIEICVQLGVVPVMFAIFYSLHLNELLLAHLTGHQKEMQHPATLMEHF